MPVRIRAPSCTTLLMTLVLGAAPEARGQELGAAITSAEKRLERLVEHRERLEARLDEQGKRVRRLKAQPAGVRRDYQLQTALRASQQLANKLTRLQSNIRGAQQRLLTAYQRALKAYTDRATRIRYARRRAALKRQMGQQPARIVVSGQARPMDGPDELEEKADLLDDSAEKVERELVRLRRRIAALQLRSKLRRHRRTAADTLFVEDTPRRLGRVVRTGRASGGGVQAAADSKGPPAGPTAAESPSAGVNSPTALDGANMTPPGNRSSSPSMDDSAAPPSASTGGAGAVPPSWSATPDVGSATPAPNLRSALDPVAFDELRRALSQGGSAGGLSKMRATAARLERLTRRLSSQASKLRQQANKRRQKP